MPKHILCYVERKRITDWKRKVLTRTDRAFIYGSNDDRVFKKMKRGDVLWIVSPVPGRPPEIVARLNVAIVAPREDSRLGVSKKLLEKFPGFKYIARGNKKSRFFGHNNAEGAFMQSDFLTPTGKRWRLAEKSTPWKSIYGRRFQRPVEIHAPGGELFERIAEAPAVFVSWKWRDNKKKLLVSLAYSLADQGFTAWLDMLAMPASESKRRLENFPEALERLLQDGYRRSSILLAVDSSHYGTQTENSAKNWTLDEWAGMLDPHLRPQRAVFHPAYAGRSKVIGAEGLHLESADPAEAARELKEQFVS